MKKIINRSWLRYTAFVLSCFLNVISFSQDKGLNISYSEQQPSTSKINFQKIAIKTKTGIFPAYDRNLKIPAINLPDTFLSKRSDFPLLRNENAGIWKKIGRAELFIGGAELLGATVLIVTPKKVTKWSHKQLLINGQKFALPINK